MLSFRTHAQTTGRQPVIGFLDSSTPAPDLAANITLPGFIEGMQSLGYFEHKQFELVARFANDQSARLSTLAQEILSARPRVIVAIQQSAAAACVSLTHSIPIVSALLTQPVEAGLIESVARPGGNLTGILAGVDGMSAKQLEIAIELLPGVSSIGLLLNPTNIAASSPQRREIEIAAADKGVTLVVAEITEDADIDAAMASLSAKALKVIIVARDALLNNFGAHVSRAATAAGLLTIFGVLAPQTAGGLVNYGVDTRASFRRTAYFVDKLLKGARPQDMPVEFPTKVAMRINLKTAKMLNVAVPRSLLIRADQVIE